MSKLVARLEQIKSKVSAGVWQNQVLSGKMMAQLKKQCRLENITFPFPEKPQVESNSWGFGMKRQPKGHKCDRVAAARQRIIKEKMKEMPNIVAAYRESRKIKGLSVVDQILLTTKQKRDKVFRVQKNSEFEQCGIEQIATIPTTWIPSLIDVALNCRLQGAVVPSGHYRKCMRLDAAHVVALDGFLDDNLSNALYDLMSGERKGIHEPDDLLWEKNVADGHDGHPTWGLKSDILLELLTNPPPIMLEIQSRLAKLYPEFLIVHLPADAMSSDIESIAPAKSSSSESCKVADFKLNSVSSDTDNLVSFEKNLEQIISPSAEELTVSLDNNFGGKIVRDGGNVTAKRTDRDCGEADVYCSHLLANAPVHGDHYNYHEDANPGTLPLCPFTKCFGDYCNREPCMPYMVSCIAYIIDNLWENNWHGETLFLDPVSDTGLFIRPKKNRIVLMDQDVLHRISPPSKLAQRPRYSMVWKLAFLPKHVNQVMSIARPEWGTPINFGSASRLRSVCEDQLG